MTNQKPHINDYKDGLNKDFNAESFPSSAYEDAQNVRIFTDGDGSSLGALLGVLFVVAIPYQAPSPRANRGIFEVNTNLEGKITAPSTVYVGYANYFDALIALIRSLPMLAHNK